jgi:peptidyl-dipeptidase A
MIDSLRVPYRFFGLALALVIAATGCGPGPSERPGAVSPSQSEPTAEEARAFVEGAEAELQELAVRASRASWIQSTYITHDSQILASEHGARVVAALARFANEAARFQDLDLPDDVERKLVILRTGQSLPAPPDDRLADELSSIVTRMESTYGAGRYRLPDGTEWDLQDMTRIMARSRSADTLLIVWDGWRTVSPPMKSDFERFVDIVNEGASSLGFPDAGALWRSAYDMDPDDFATELDRLWSQVRPLYESLHCHVRARLADEYGEDEVPLDRPMPAHLLGNMWAQQWNNIYELVAPAAADPGYDVTERLEAEGYDAISMTRQAEGFFSSLGLDPLPETFWERSMFVQPRDREVVCHASAWNVDDVEDLRIKMCIEVNAEDFQVIHHELGHNYYQRAYNRQPHLFRGSANDGFHEALGDAVALSVTPEYLLEIGLIDALPSPESDLGLLMRDALNKIAFLPFGLLVDQWRWRVFSGEAGPDAWNRTWWELRERYQGVRAPSERTEEHFDPGAKYHVPANVPYTRYFLAHILQFQFHQALCEIAGFEGPLHRCSIYGSEEAGARLNAMMEMGRSRPWPDALEALTGRREMDATAILDYFAPLGAWLEEQNRGRTCGW